MYKIAKENLSAYTFAAAARRTDVPARIAADTFAQLLLEKCKFLFRAHRLDARYLYGLWRVQQGMSPGNSSASVQPEIHQGYQ